jgi:hypothetical protein
MNVIRTLAIAGLVIGFGATSLTAAEGDKPKRPSIDELDADKDGALSKTELEAVPERMRGYLLKSDADMNGELSKEELAKAKEEMAKRREQREKERGGEKPPGEAPK